MRLQNNEEILNHSIFKTKKSVQKSCTSYPWHVNDRLEFWPTPGQCFICKPL